jgi:hypothetical protein
VISVDLLFSLQGAELLDGGLGHFSQLQLFGDLPVLVCFVLENSAPLRLCARLHREEFGDLLSLRFRVKKAVSKSTKITNHDAWQYSLDHEIGEQCGLDREIGELRGTAIFFNRLFPLI